MAESESKLESIHSNIEDDESTLPNFLFSNGIDCRLYLGERIKGDLKTVPEDFIVTEVDLKDQLVVLNKDTPIISPPSNIPTSNTSNSPPLSPTELLSEEEYDTSRVLSEEQLVALHDLSQKWEEFALKETMPLSDSVNLGVYHDKETRGNVHEEVTKLFPILKTAKNVNKEKNAEIIAFPDPAYQRLLPFIGPQETTELLHFIKSGSSGIHYLPVDASRENRTKIHRTINELYGKFLVTNTVTYPSSPVPSLSSSLSRKRKRENDERLSETNKQELKCIVVKFKKDTRRMSSKEEHTRKSYYTKFVLKKENCETLKAILMICNSLSIGIGRLKVAGNKDKIAITFQNVTAKDISMSRLSSVNCPGLELGSFEYVDKELKTGDLMGNHFKIRIRNITEKDTELRNNIKACVESLKCNGFVNYLGIQRFGFLHDDNPLVTPLVGLYLLLNEPEKAVKAIFRPRGDSDHYKEAKEYFTRTGDVKGSIPLMKGCTREVMILKALNRYGTTKFGYQHAFMSLPHQTRSMITQSFTSLIWNHLASCRIQEYGTSLIEGDLVLMDNKRGVWDGDRVIPMTREDLNSGRYSIKDVVLPFPGYKITPPNNRVGEKLIELLGTVGLSLLSFKRQRFFSCPGAYRKLISYPQEIKWEMSTVPCVTPSITATPTIYHQPCVNLEFKLNSGSYVTTMMNELLY